MNARSPSLDDIFFAAREVTNAEDRAAYLDRVCGDDEELRRRVERLLDAQSKVGSFLESPAPSPTVSVNGETVTEGPGQSIGPYKLMEQIGEGGMGFVYVAEQHQPVRRKVALKIIKPGMDTKQVVARFEAERQALAMMDHPNIAKVHDGGTTPSGRPYFVMELVRGIPITEYCDREKLSIPERLELFVLVCRAVQHAHQKGIIHRDLKPSNILVTVIDGAAVPKVIDFGVAKATGGSLTERTVYTAFQQFIGTPLYMSPEQADLAGVDVDTRSDIYSLGVLLYELLTGTTPFDQETFRTAAFDEMRRILREQEPPRPSTRLSTLGAAATTVSANRKSDVRQLDRTIRGELDWVVMKALEKDRRRRYETAGEFAADIMRYLTDQPVEACPPSAWYRFSKLARRHRATLVTSTVVAASLVLGTAVSTWEAIRATGAERAADTARAAESNARKRAEESEKTARAEADKAKAINDFLVNDLLVRSGEPGRNRDPLTRAEPGQETVASRITLREALDRAAEKVGERFHDLPLVEAALRTTISDTYHGLMAWAECRKQAAVALEIYEREKGPGAVETLNAVRRLGHALNDEHKRTEAEPLILRSLDGLRRVLGEGHPDTLKAMDDLAILYQDQGKSGEAEQLLRRSIDSLRRALGEGHPDTLHAMDDLAGLYEDRGKVAEAETLGVKVLEGRRRTQGDEHPDTLRSMRNMGLFYRDHGKRAQAEQLLVKALEGHRRVLGEGHPHTLDCMIELARLYRWQGQFHRAEPLLLQALEVGRRALGEDHIVTNNAMFWLGRHYQQEGQNLKAEQFIVKALDGRRRTLGKEHDVTLSTLHFLAGLYWSMGRLSQAEPLFLEYLEAQRRHHGEENLEIANGYNCLACIYWDWGKLAEAESLFTKALEIGRRRPWGESLDTLNFVNGLAGVHEETGQLEKAEPLYREALEMLRQRHQEASSVSAKFQSSLARNLLKQQKSEGYAEAEALSRESLKFRERNEADDYTTFHTKSLLGASLLGQKKYAEAEPLLLAGYEGMRQREGKIPAVRKFRMTDAIEWLVQFYEATGKTGKADEWRKKLTAAKSVETKKR
jgi:serine/threonine protein kinase